MNNQKILAKEKNFSNINSIEEKREEVYQDTFQNESYSKEDLSKIKNFDSQEKEKLSPSHINFFIANSNEKNGKFIFIIIF